MSSFTFDSAARIQKAVKYLGEFDDTLRFSLTELPAGQSLYLTTVKIHPFCYTDYTFQTVADAPPAKRYAAEPNKTNWAINSGLLTRVLGCFDPTLELMFEIGEESGHLLLLQQDPEGVVTRVMQVGVMHDLGPSLSIEHNIGEMYRIADIDGFRQVSRAAAVADDPACVVSLSWEEDGQCYLKIISDTAKFLVHLGFLAHRPSMNLEGRVRCADMETFGALCERTRGGGSARGVEEPQKARQQLSIGFGDDGLSLLRLQWFTAHGESTANLFFCTA